MYNAILYQEIDCLFKRFDNRKQLYNLQTLIQSAPKCFLTDYASDYL